MLNGRAFSSLDSEKKEFDSDLHGTALPTTVLRTIYCTFYCTVHYTVFSTVRYIILYFLLYFLLYFVPPLLMPLWDTRTGNNPTDGAILDTGVGGERRSAGAQERRSAGAQERRSMHGGDDYRIVLRRRAQYP